MLVVILSLGAAFLFAAAAVFQQQATREAGAARALQPPTRTGVSGRLPVVRILRDLVRSPVWLLGWGVNLMGFLTQAAALHLGSVAFVQPLLVTQLLFTLPLVSLQGRRWPLPREWLAGGLICCGVAVFLSVRGGVHNVGSADRSRILLATAAAAGLVLLLVAASTERSRATHSALIAVAAGLCFALSAVFIKLTATDLLHRGIPATAVDWPGYALAGSTVLGLVLEQEAFRTGALPITMTAVTITNPVASYLIGVLAFDVAPPTSPGALAGIAGAAALLTIGTMILAASPTVLRDDARAGVAGGHLRPDVPS